MTVRHSAFKVATLNISINDVLGKKAILAVDRKPQN
jgi:hypothetical protein